MGNHRMFSKGVTESDKFLDMPLSAQALYMHLGLNADDDGFVNNPKKIQRMVGAADDDLKILFAKGFVINFETGIVVITHWKQQNTIRKDRYKGTLYREELAMLSCNDVGDYALNGIPTDNQVTTNWQPSDNQAGTENADLTTDGCHKVRQGKARQDKVIQGNVSEDTLLSGKPDGRVGEIVDYLNLVLGTHYKVNGKKTGSLIRSRLKEGYTVEDFKQVISKKYAEWAGTEREKYLRPETLFCADHFEGYLNQMYVAEKSPVQSVADEWMAWAEREEAKERGDYVDTEGVCEPDGDGDSFLPDFGD